MMLLKKSANAIKKAGCRANYMLRECFSQSSRQVDFIVGGVQKGGTSALDWYLRKHPQICMASRKEVHFFDNEIVQKCPAHIRFSYYHSFFSSCGYSKVLGEATPIYIWWPKCLERIKSYNSRAKLIFVLRDPVFRAYSHWNMERQRGFEKDSFSDSIRREGAVKDQSRISSYVSRGFYSSQVKHAKALFPDNQLLFIKQEELLGEPDSVLQRVTDFLGLSPIVDVQKKRVHSRGYESPLSYEDEKLLRSLFLADVEELERELRWDLSDWKKVSDFSRNRVSL